jgi:mRNA interferase MazF
MVSRSAAPTAGRKTWVPERQQVIWIDCNPQAGSEMRDWHPLLVLSPSAFNARTGIVIGLPMTTAPYNVSNPFAVPVGTTGKPRGRSTSKTSYVLCHQPKSFDWRARGAKPHTSGLLDNTAFAQVCQVLNQIITLT